jgi:hypothetical protein
MAYENIAHSDTVLPEVTRVGALRSINCDNNIAL